MERQAPMLFNPSGLTLTTRRSARENVASMLTEISK